MLDESDESEASFHSAIENSSSDDNTSSDNGANSEGTEEEINLPVVVRNAESSEAITQRSSGRVVNKWTNDRVFNNEEEKHTFFYEQETYWRVRKSNVLVDGNRKTFFYCSQIQRRRGECPAKVCVLADTSTNQLILQRNQFEHVHDLPRETATGKRRVPLSDDIFQKIKELVDLNVKRRKIRQNVLHNDDHNPKPTTSQVSNFHFFLLQCFHVIFIFFIAVYCSDGRMIV